MLFFAPRLHVVTGVWTAIEKKSHMKVDHGLLARVLIQDNSMRFFRCRFDPDQNKLRWFPGPDDVSTLTASSLLTELVGTVIPPHLVS